MYQKFSDLVKVNGKHPRKKPQTIQKNVSFRMDGKLVGIKKGKTWFRRVDE